MQILIFEVAEFSAGYLCRQTIFTAPKHKIGMIKEYAYLMIMIIMATVSGCVPFYHATMHQNVPMLKEKGEGIVGLGADILTSKIGAELNAAYAFANHFATTANVSIAYSDEDNAIELNLFGGGPYDYMMVTHQSIGASLGYFTKIKNEHFLFELYSGCAISKLDFENSISGHYASTKMTKYYAQPSFSYSSFIRKKVGFALAVSARVGAVRYFDISGGVREELQSQRPLDLFEPAFTGSLGPFSKVPLKVRFQLSQSIPFYGFSPPIEILNFSVGVFYWIKPLSERRNN
jgi:hypothetical protein